MSMMRGVFAGTFLLVLLSGAAVQSLVEEKTGTEYPDQIVVGDDPAVTLRATGVGLREKTFMKVDVYTIASYVEAAADLGEDPGRALRSLQAPRRLQMDLRRSFGRDKLLGAFRDGIAANFDDLSALAADMQTFESYFDRDAQEGDRIIFHYCPERGLVTELNGQILGTIPGAAFAEALWTVWFGDRPANQGLKRALLGAL